jgi:hypothetical protein
VKQTKPYGRAATIANHTSGRPGKGEQSPATDPLAVLEPDASTAQAPLAREYQQPSKKTREVGNRGMSWFIILFLVVALGMPLYVLIRDFNVIGSFTDNTYVKDATMVCTDGSIHYDGLGILDRILGNGSFGCTEWRITKRYTVLPQ